MDNTPYTPVKRFWKLLENDKKDIRDIYFYSVFKGLINLSLPLGIQAIINFIQGARISASWIVLILIVVIGVLLNGILQIYQLRITENLQQKIFSRAAITFAFRIPKIRSEELYPHYPPELMNRFFDIVPIQKGLPKILIDLSTAILQILFGLILLSFYHPFFIIFSLILVLLLAGIIFLTAGKGLQTSLLESKMKYKLAYWLEELARNYGTFKLAGKSDLHLRKTDDHISDYAFARDLHFKVLLKQFNYLISFKVLITIGLLLIGGMLVMNQQMNIGQFIAAEIIILLVIDSIEKIILNLENLYDVLTSLEKIGQISDLKLESPGTVIINPDLPMKLQLENLTFTYPGSREPSLKQINLVIHPGERIVITGEEGSGKSTLMRLIAGLYTPQNGHISYNGFPASNLEFDSLWSCIGDALMIEQIFHGSILDNITLDRSGIDFAEVHSLAEATGLAEFVRNLPHGYNTILDPQGQKLPSGIISKIILLRSLAGKPSLLLIESIFDQWSSAEKDRILNFVFSKQFNHTVIMLSDDPVVKKYASRMINLSEGKIVKDERTLNH